MSQPQPLRCTLLCHSSAQHLQQLYAGFGILSENDAIVTDVRKAPDYNGSTLGKPILTVILNGCIRITYDTSDTEELFEDELSASDFYFKRSYSPDLVSRHPQAPKLYPLGFNYPVYGPNDYTLQRLSWSIGSKHFFPLLMRNNHSFSRLFRIRSGRAFCHVDDLEGSPRYDDRPRILFLTRVWAPGGDTVPPDNVQERYEINDMRASCIRRLRREFGTLFTGGLQPNTYAMDTFPDCVVDDERVMYKENYLKLMKRASICISTTGLQKSNPWKLAEYIAGAKAIVSERIWHSVPGSFQAGKNYLEFQNPDDCVEKVHRLVEQPDLRYEMMKANRDYYYSSLRPDTLVCNSLDIALGNVESDRAPRVRSMLRVLKRA